MTVARAAFDMAAAAAEEASKGTNAMRDRILAVLNESNCFCQSRVGTEFLYIPQLDAWHSMLAEREAGNPDTMSPHSGLFM